MAETSIIEFPGGAVEVTRCKDGTYWVHVIVNQQAAFADGSPRETKRGVVVDTRMTTPRGVFDFPDHGPCHDYAVRVQPL